MQRTRPRPLFLPALLLLIVMVLLSLAGCSLTESRATPLGPSNGAAEGERPGNIKVGEPVGGNCSPPGSRVCPSYPVGE